jgi:hypothetical protein
VDDRDLRALLYREELEARADRGRIAGVALMVLGAAMIARPELLPAISL